MNLDIEKIDCINRAQTAREEISKIFADEKNELYFAKDIELSKKFNISRHTMYKIRDELNVPSRSKRILNALKKFDLNNISVNEMSRILNLKYQNLYKIVTENNISFKQEKKKREKTSCND